MKTWSKTHLGANTLKTRETTTPKANTKKKKGSLKHLLLQPDEEPLVVAKVIRQYTRKKKESAGSINKLASATCINVAAALSEQNDSIFLVNNHVKIKEEIRESFHNIEMMNFEVEIENNVKTEKKPESQNGKNKYIKIKEENIVTNASCNSDQNCKYGDEKIHVQENVAAQKGNLVDINLHQINLNQIGDTVKIKEESVHILSDVSIMNNDSSMNSNVCESVQKTAKTTIKIEPADDSQYMNYEQKHIVQVPTDCSQSEEDINVIIKPTFEIINCHTGNGKMGSRYCENKDMLSQNYQELVPILKLQQTLNVANVQAPKKKNLITEEIHIKEEAISDTEDWAVVKDKRPSSIEVKYNTPITDSSIELKDKTPVAPSSIEVKHNTPITDTSIELKDNTPVATSSIEVKHNILITGSSIELKDKTPVATISIELKHNTPINASSIELKHNTPVTASSIEIKQNTPITASNIEVKHNTPITDSSIELKDKTPVAPNSIEIKHNTPLIASSIELKNSTPVTASNIEVKHNTPTTDSSIELKDKTSVLIQKKALPGKIKIRRIMNMPKILKTYGRKQPDPVAMQNCFLLPVPLPAKILRMVHQKFPKFKTLTEPKLICDMCGQKFRSKNGLSNHARSAHGVAMRHSCGVCSASFPHHYLMLAHWRAHAGVPLTCDLCPKSFRTTQKYGEHLNTHLRERLFPCPICLQRFPVLSHSQRHAEKHTPEDTFPCNICEERYRSLIDLKRHSERDHGEKEEFPCYVCNRILSSRADFLTHVTAHDNAFYACVFCPRKFTDAQKWEEHSFEHIEKIGRGESTAKPYSCEYCKKSFEYRSTMITHIRMHTGERPYECPQCKKKLKTQSALTEHINGHKRPYTCPECKQRFGKRETLSRHILLHTGERPYLCTGCPMTFVQRSSMMKHIQRFHEPGLKRVPKNKSKGTKKVIKRRMAGKSKNIDEKQS